MSTLARIAMVVALPSCVFSAPDPEPEPAIAYAGEATCMPSQCGKGNSPVIDGVPFWALHRSIENNQHVVIEYVRAADSSIITLTTPNPGYFLVGVKRDGTAIAGQQLVDTKIFLRVRKKHFVVNIDAVTPTHLREAFWFSPAPEAEYYNFSYAETLDGTPPTTGYVPLCTPEHLAEGTSMIRALVFGRDVYDPDTKKVSFDTSPLGWFNIACEFGAPWKMQMSGYTRSTQTHFGHFTTDAEKQTLLNAWTANYCGSGKAFTRPGEPITLHESRGLLAGTPYDDVAQTVDAVWGPDRALCLGTPRLADKDSTILSKIAAECPLPPPCSSTTPAGTVKTGNPYPPPILIAP